MKSQRILGCDRRRQGAGWQSLLLCCCRAKNLVERNSWSVLVVVTKCTVEAFFRKEVGIDETRGGCNMPSSAGSRNKSNSLRRHLSLFHPLCFQPSFQQNFLQCYNFVVLHTHVVDQCPFYFTLGRYGWSQYKYTVEI